MRGTKSRRCGKKFFKTLAVGQINNGLYFGRSQQYLSVVSGIFTLIGAFVLIVLSIKVFIDIFTYANVQAKLVYEQYDIYRDDNSLSYFLRVTDLKFKVKAYDFWELNNEPLDCTVVQASLLYYQANEKDPINMKMSCIEISEALFYYIQPDEAYDTIRISNSQYFKLQFTYIGPDFVEPKTKLYLLYKGKNILFTGDNIVDTDFTSLELPFGSFYKTQMSPFLLRNVTNLWQLGIPRLTYHNTSRF